MSDGARRLCRADGRDVLICTACGPAIGAGNGRFLARMDGTGLWLWCRSCRTERLVDWATVAATLVSYWPGALPLLSLYPERGAE